MTHARMATTRAAGRVGGMVALSMALHALAFGSLAKVQRAPTRERVEIEVVRRARPASPAPPIAPAPPPPAAPRRIPMQRPLPRAPTPPAPPPTAAPPPRDAPREPRPLARIGISLASTVSSGGIAVPVGNGLRGKVDETAADPSSVPPAPARVAAARLSAQPRPLALPRIAYPADARKAGTEGRVVLVLAIDAQGRVTSARVVEAPAPSLAAAARDGARRFRFAPALLDGAPVATEIRFTYTFLLD